MSRRSFLRRVAPGRGIPARRAGASPVIMFLAPRTGGETRRQAPKSVNSRTPGTKPLSGRGGPRRAANIPPAGNSGTADGSRRDGPANRQTGRRWLGSTNDYRAEVHLGQRHAPSAEGFGSAPVTSHRHASSTDVVAATLPDHGQPPPLCRSNGFAVLYFSRSST